MGNFSLKFVSIFYFFRREEIKYYREERKYYNVKLNIFISFCHIKGISKRSFIQNKIFKEKISVIKGI